jgi:hypothetical protein
MLTLCSFTQPLFSAPNLKSLDIRFEEYPSSLSQGLIVFLVEILPLDFPSSRLETLHVRYQPVTMSELEILVARYLKILREFDWYCGWLFDGN